MGSGPRNEQKMTSFREVLDGDLFDMGQKSDKYTWGNKHGDVTFRKERLDGAVANPCWSELYKNMCGYSCFMSFKAYANNAIF